MKLVGRIPVEPLSDERLTNIERKIVAGAADALAAHQPRESRWGVFAFAAVTVVLVAGAGLVGWKLRGPGEQPVVAEAAPLTIDSDAKATAIDIGDAKITSELGTKFTITRPGTGVTIAMAHGKVGLEVGKRGSRDPLIVRAGETDVVVVGTQFTVDFDGHDNVDVRVTEGVVKVVRKGAEARVAAGQAWQTTRGTIALADAGPSGRPLIADADRKPDEIEIPTGPRKDIALHDRTAKVPDARISTNGNAGSGQKNVGAPEVTHQPTPPVTPHAALQQDVLSRLAKAQPILPATGVGNLTPAAAVSVLREQSLKTGPEASAAMYSIAVLQVTKLGRAGDAITTLDAYVRRFRGGTEYKAALWLRVVIKCRQAIDDHCRQAAFTYAHEAPGSKEGELASLLSTMTSE